jgi:hypothetical protein
MSAQMEAQSVDLAEADFDDVAQRVDELRDRIRHSDPSTQSLLDETVEALTEFNKRGLITLV